MMPVPRDLSSSCGTCVRFVTEDIDALPERPEEMEQMVQVADTGYTLLYRAKDS